MNSKGKYIGIDQRIPFEVLDASIHFFLMNGIVDRSNILKHMLEFTLGINRANKGGSAVAKIITRQEHLLLQLKKNLKESSYISLRIEDRKVLCLCLICLTYPITYDLLVSLGQGFKVQDQINKKFISEKVMSVYGSNRSVDIAIDALLPMIIELNTIKRDKVSLYSIAPKTAITNKFFAELVIYTDIKLSGSKSILVADLHHKPWYSYFDVSTIKSEKYSHLITKTESVVGGGYLTISV